MADTREIEHLRLRLDGRYEVDDTAEGDQLYGCKRDSWCILSEGHNGRCADDRELDPELWAHPDAAQFALEFWGGTPPTKED